MDKYNLKGIFRQRNNFDMRSRSYDAVTEVTRVRNASISRNCKRAAPEVMLWIWKSVASQPDG
jgi:hypothetical protein